VQLRQRQREAGLVEQRRQRGAREQPRAQRGDHLGGDRVGGEQHAGLLEQLAGGGDAQIAAVIVVGRAAREHVRAAHERRALAPSQQEHLDPDLTRAQKDHGRSIARRRVHASLYHCAPGRCNRAEHSWYVEACARSSCSR
jgi:hypothetical protein